MLLSLSTIPTYLAGRGHLPLHAWLDDECSLAPMPGRHRNFRVESPTRTGLLIKQLRQPTDANLAAQRNEVAFLEAMQSDRLWQAFRAVAPRVLDADRSRNVLITDYVTGQTYHEFYASSKQHNDTEATSRRASELGVALALLHTCGRSAFEDSQYQWLPTELPAAITLRPPSPDAIATLSLAQRWIIESIQSDKPFVDSLFASQKSWCCDTVIHGDLKWDNLIVATESESRIRIVDWELVSKGDAAWDVAGVLQSHIAFEVAEPCNPDPARGAAASADANTFWAAYTERAGLSDDAAFADRVRRLTANRLVQTAIERSAGVSTIDSVSAQLLQTSRTLLFTPTESLTHISRANT